jgi:putative ABC transport system ATP-binding protein
VGLLGPSGSGKSSLLFLLAGLRQPTRGRLIFRGAEWPRNGDRAAELRRSAIGLVFSDPFLVPYLTVRENAMLQALPDVPPSRVEVLADALGIGHLVDEFPTALSSGEAQRASVLRALVNGPQLVLADEPTAHLDRETGLQAVSALRHSAIRSSLVIASHDPRVLATADRICTLDDGLLVTNGAA